MSSHSSLKTGVNVFRSFIKLQASREAIAIARDLISQPGDFPGPQRSLWFLQLAVGAPAAQASFKYLWFDPGDADVKPSCLSLRIPLRLAGTRHCVCYWQSMALPATELSPPLSSSPLIIPRLLSSLDLSMHRIPRGGPVSFMAGSLPSCPDSGISQARG